MIALDFDGVIANGIQECLLSAWATQFNFSVASFDAVALDSIPSDFVAHFTYLRNFVRHDGHFQVSFKTASGSISSQDDFDKAYAEIGQAEVKSFRTRFALYRQEVRRAKPDFWLKMHKIFPEMRNILLHQKVAIVSGKDTASIIAILAGHGIVIPPEYVFGSLTNKTSTLEDLRTQTGASLLFCDDNLLNVIEAKALGIASCWALWGYHTEEHLDQAQTLGIAGVSIPAFLVHVARHQQQLN